MFALDFVGNRAMSGGQHIALNSAIQVTRASSKYALTAERLYRQFAPNVPALTNAGLSIEPAATNLCLHSNDLGQGIWNRSGLGVAGGYPDPAGGNTAFRVTEAGPTAALSRTATTAVTPGTTYTLSRIVRRGNFDRLGLAIGDAGFVNATYLWFDLSTNALATSPPEAPASAW